MKVVSFIKGRANGALLSAVCLALLATGCATAPPPEDKEATAAFNEANDPYEPFNRAMLDFNLALDKAILRPVSYVYREAIPDPLQDNIHNFLENLRGPIIFVNNLLQGDYDRAGNTLLRFAMNSTIGIMGINDFAAEAGIEKNTEDFGQTLATWDVEPGPYLVLPIFGPSNPRDAFGLVADTLADPFTWVTSFEFRLSRSLATAVDKRSRNFEEIDDLEKNSLDFYSAIRSLYRQKRKDDIRNGTTGQTVPGGLSKVPGKSKKDQQSLATPDKQ